MTNGYARQPQSDGADKRTTLGLVVDGSLSQGIEVRLDPAASIEDIKVGAFVTIQGQHSTFFGTVTDVTLGSTDPRLKHTPPQVDDALVLQVVSGTVAYGAISVLPQPGASDNPGRRRPSPVRSQDHPAALRPNLPGLAARR